MMPTQEPVKIVENPTLYLLTQITDIIMQIYLAWTPLIKEVKQSIKNTSSRLLESFRRHPITNEDVSYIEQYTTVYLE